LAYFESGEAMNNIASHFKIIALLALSAMFAILPADAAEDLTILAKSFSPRVISKPDSMKAELLVSLNRSASIRVNILDQDLDKVHEAEFSGKEGDNSIQLDFSPIFDQLHSGAHYFSVTATTPDGKQAIYHPEYASALKQITLQKASFSSESKTFEFLMPAIGMVNVRLYKKPSFYVTTLFEWNALPAGPTKFKWDGKDSSGNSFPLIDDEAEVRFSAFTLPSNVFLITAQRTKPPRDRKAQIEWQQNPALQMAFSPSRIPRERAHAPRITLETEAADGKWLPAAPLKVDKPFRIRMRVHPDDVQQVVDERFELCAYLNGHLMFEEEDGVTPHTFSFDPTGFSEGPHLLSVVLMTSFDHVGSSSIPLNIQKSQKAKQESENTK
jgi:hypothetical protein